MPHDHFLLAFFDAKAESYFIQVLSEELRFETGLPQEGLDSSVAMIDESMVKMWLALIISSAERRLCASYLHHYITQMAAYARQQGCTQEMVISVRVHYWFAKMPAAVFESFAAALCRLPMLSVVEQMYHQSPYQAATLLYLVLEVYRKFALPSLPVAFKTLRSTYSALKEWYQELYPARDQKNKVCGHSLRYPEGQRYLCEVYKDHAFYAPQAFLRHEALLHVERQSFFVYFTKLINGHYQINRLSVVGAILLDVFSVIGLSPEAITDFDRRFRQRFSSPSVSLYLLCLPRYAFGEIHTVSLEYNTQEDFWCCVALIKKHCILSQHKVMSALRSARIDMLDRMKINYHHTTYPVFFSQENTHWGAFSSWSCREKGLLSLCALLHAHVPSISHMVQMLSDIMSDPRNDKILYRLGCQCSHGLSSWHQADGFSVLVQNMLSTPCLLIHIGNMYFVSFLCDKNKNLVHTSDGGEWVGLCDLRHGDIWHIHALDVFIVLHIVLSVDLSSHAHIKKLNTILSVHKNDVLSLTSEWDVMVRKQTRKGECEYVLRKNGKLVSVFHNLPDLKKQVRVRLSILDQPLSMAEAASAYSESLSSPIYYAAAQPADLEVYECLVSQDRTLEEKVSATYHYHPVSHQKEQHLSSRWMYRFVLLGLKDKPRDLYQQARMRLYLAIHNYCAVEEESITACLMRDAICMDLEDGYLMMEDWIVLSKDKQHELGIETEADFWASQLGQRWIQLLYSVRFNMCGPEGEIFKSYCEARYHDAHNKRTVS